MSFKQFRSSSGTGMSSLFSLFLNTDSDEADITSLGFLFAITLVVK